jgi:hypothetical protein
MEEEIGCRDRSWSILEREDPILDRNSEHDVRSGRVNFRPKSSLYGVERSLVDVGI